MRDLMFGQQAHLPLDVMFENNTPTASSPGEYATALQKQLQTAYELVRERLSKSHIRQNELYNHKVHGRPHKPKSHSHKLHHQWT